MPPVVSPPGNHDQETAVAHTAESLPTHMPLQGMPLQLVVRFGRGFTISRNVSDARQRPLVPAKVYVVVVVGATCTVAVVAPPALHVYVVAPEPVSVTLLPLHEADCPAI